MDVKLDFCEEGWALESGCVWTVVLEDSRESADSGRCESILEGDVLGFLWKGMMQSWSSGAGLIFESWLIGKESSGTETGGIGAGEGQQRLRSAEWHHGLDEWSLSELKGVTVMNRRAWRAFAIHGVWKAGHGSDQTEQTFENTCIQVLNVRHVLQMYYVSIWDFQ